MPGRRNPSPVRSPIMMPRPAVAAGAAVAVLLAGCSSETSEPAPDPVVMVRQAQQRVTLAGTGALTVRSASRLQDADLRSTWSGFYDLSRHLWTVTVAFELGSRRGTLRMIGTADHTYQASNEAYAPQYRGKWLVTAGVP